MYFAVCFVGVGNSRMGPREGRDYRGLQNDSYSPAKIRILVDYGDRLIKQRGNRRLAVRQIQDLNMRMNRANLPNAQMEREFPGAG